MDMNDYRSRSDQILFALSSPNYKSLIRNFGRIIFLGVATWKDISTKMNYLNFYKVQISGILEGGVTEVGVVTKRGTT